MNFFSFRKGKNKAGGKSKGLYSTNGAALAAAYLTQSSGKGSSSSDKVGIGGAKESNWVSVTTTGETPSPRYGHSIVRYSSGSFLLLFSIVQGSTVFQEFMLSLEDPTR